jgi:4-hydroxy-4-methyl-2-oxoglutarate aldolase
MGFKVWSRAVHAQGTVKETLGSVNVPIICAGQLVEPGDVVVADDDGVVIVRREELTGVFETSRKRARIEEEKRVRLAAGELGLDIYEMRQKLIDRGLTYYDSLTDVQG